MSAKKGFVQVPVAVEDALAYVIEWYAVRGWTVLEEDARYQSQGGGRFVMVSAWAAPPRKEEG